MWQCADAYRVQYPYFVLSAFCIVYITLQTLAIPGPIVLSVLSGALYDPIPAQLLVAFCATTGASLCFTISYFLGNDIVHVLLPSMITRFRKKVRLWPSDMCCYCVLGLTWLLLAQTQANKHNLFYYLLFLRLTPLLPNWFVNVASPVVGVPLWKFALATFIGAWCVFEGVTALPNIGGCHAPGLVPANYFHSQTGRTMANLQPGASLSENKSTFMVLMVLQLVPLIPTFFKSKLQKMEEAKFGAAEDSKKQQ